MSRNVAVVHETAFELGGGVRVAIELARTFDAPLYFGFAEPEVIEKIPDEVETRRLFADSRLRPLRNRPIVRSLYYLWNFQYRPELREYDVVIQSASGTEWYVPPEEQALVRYNHSLPAAPYQEFQERGGSTAARLFGFASRILRLPNRYFPDANLANSETTQRLLRKYLAVESTVAYPPIETGAYERQEREDFYLVVSRLRRGKRVDGVVETFTRALSDRNLVVVGSGPMENELRSMGGPNVDVRGWVDEAEKRRLLGSAKAVVMNSGNESFGIVAAEALASGTPVLGVDDGYTRYQIRDGWNGLLYSRGTLSDAVERFEEEGVAASREELESFADRYGREAFRERAREAVERAAERVEISGP